ncbi:MAG: S-layer family protein, partial [Cyanobacteria bacterium SID2]|nr:S-layer family protein [Cyanobacteria bacterium SID2]
GGDVRLESGDLTAFQGDIQLASVESADRVNILPTATGIEFDGSSIERWGTIDISGTANVNASGLGGGAIRLRGSEVVVRDSASLIAATLGAIDGRSISIEADRITLRDGMLLSTATFGTGRGGDLQLQATESIDFIGADFTSLLLIQLQAVLGTLDLATVDGVTIVGTDSVGDAGDVRIETERLRLQNGAVLATTTGASGNGGDIEIFASDSVEIDRSFLATGSLQGTSGNSGNVTIETGQLRLTDGGVINTFTFGSGLGGNLRVLASESVEILDTPLNAILPVGLFANSIFGTGKGGNIDVRTRRIVMRGGGQTGNQSGALLSLGLIPSGGPGGNINLEATDSIEIVGLSPDGQFGSGPGTTTFSESPAGNITISTGELIVRDGASIEATTLNSAPGGSISIAVDRLELSGTGTANRQGTPIDFPSSLGASSGREDFPDLVASGTAGDLQVRAGEIVVRDGARITVTSLGTGDAGTLDIEADALFLDNGGRLDAATGSGAGGNLRVRAPILQLRENSLISTDAGNTDGGNITLETDTLVALDNSDITANARRGRGGRVEITAQGIFGTAFRESLTPESDITATSDLGPAFSGIVELNTPDANTDAGLVDLPEDPIDPNAQVTRGCAATQGNTFVVTGRGGIPENPIEGLRDTASWGDVRDWRMLEGGNGEVEEEATLEEDVSIVEATTWVYLDDGSVQLVTSNPESLGSLDLANDIDRSACPPVRDDRPASESQLQLVPRSGQR